MMQDQLKSFMYVDRPLCVDPKKVNELTSETKKLLKKQKLDTSIKQQIQKSYASLRIMVKQNTMEGHMQTM